MIFGVDGMPIRKVTNPNYNRINQLNDYRSDLDYRNTAPVSYYRHDDYSKNLNVQVRVELHIHDF